ncbi:heavy-metal-associated domain-containing protein [Pararhodonellum marinum]|uniref:heavy-metal-associated domain-containing protein n=1 Tax=Pararhodonellum marinum TaxID=2755358 RepID=UPI00188DDFA5|nr:heavy metal transport/detoxification protein [Pararhodonellum marinum]
MTTIKLKTNVKCGACVQAISPQMEQLGLESWNVDLQDPNRILTATGTVTEASLQQALQKAGYHGEPVK